jgi:hypothetical protein
MRELLICDGCGHQADGVKELRILDSFARADAAGEIEVLVVECRCGDRAEVSLPPAA